MFGNRSDNDNPYEALRHQLDRAMIEVNDSISFCHYGHIHNPGILSQLQTAQTALMDAAGVSDSHTAIWEADDGDTCQ